MPVRPRASLPVLAGAGVLVLAGCGLEQPSPHLTVQAGAASVRVDAACWSFEPEQEAQDCEGGEAASLDVRPGQRLGISVDKAIAEAGWAVQVNGEQLSTGVERDTYFAVDLPAQLPDEFELTVVANTEADGPDAQSVRGRWRTVLTAGGSAEAEG